MAFASSSGGPAITQGAPPASQVVASPIGLNSHLPKLHVVTFMNKVSNLFAYLQVSAETHGISPHIIGYGVDAWWPAGLGAKINALRAFVRGTQDDDVVLFADAFDVIIFGEDLLGPNGSKLNGQTSTHLEIY